MSDNRYGLDADYFRKKLKLIARDVDDYTPAEIIVELQRLLLVAEESLAKHLAKQGDISDE